MIKYFSQLAIPFTLLILCGVCFPINAQKTKSTSLKIIETKPSVYISFDHSGKQDALFEGDSNNRTWLRLHNNTKLKIFFCEYSVDKEYGDVGIFYEVERFAYFNEYKNEKSPNGYGRADNCNVHTLASGKSVLFSLPSESLTKGLRIKTQFFYGWTGDWKEDIYEGIINFVTFAIDRKGLSN